MVPPPITSSVSEALSIGQTELACELLERQLGAQSPPSIERLSRFRYLAGDGPYPGFARHLLGIVARQNPNRLAHDSSWTVDQTAELLFFARGEPLDAAVSAPLAELVETELRAALAAEADDPQLPGSQALFAVDHARTSAAAAMALLGDCGRALEIFQPVHQRAPTAETCNVWADLSAGRFPVDWHEE